MARVGSQSWVALLLAGCGRLAFDPTTLDGDPGELTVTVTGSGRVVSTPAGIDCPGSCSATLPQGTVVELELSVGADRYFSGWSGACTGRATSCTLTMTTSVVVGAVVTDPPNRVFVTSSTTPADFGGLAGGDALCAAAATAAGLPGNFVAWLSTSSVDARDRLTGSRGWVRVDGEPVADTVSLLLAGTMFNPITVDETGTEASLSSWTGTGSDGRASALGTCTNWTATSGFGEVGDSDLAAPGFSSGGGGVLCNGSRHLYCFETGHSVAVAAVGTPGRLAFNSTTQGGAGAAGVAGLDAICHDEAVAAGLQGTFLAAVATTTASVASRFPTDVLPWRRPDGTRVTDTAGALFQRKRWRSFINQFADGSYDATGAGHWTGVVGDPAQPGTVAATCTSWTIADLGTFGVLGLGSSNDGDRAWAVTSGPCTTQARVLCLQAIP